MKALSTELWIVEALNILNQRSTGGLVQNSYSLLLCDLSIMEKIKRQPYHVLAYIQFQQGKNNRAINFMASCFAAM